MDNLGLIIGVATVLIALLGLIFGMLKHFESNMDKRFDAIDARLLAVDGRFEAMSADINLRFEEVNRRLEAMNKRFDSKFDEVNRQIFALAMNLRPHLVEPTDEDEASTTRSVRDLARN